MDDLLILTPNGRWTAFLEEFLGRSLHLGIRDIRFSSVSLAVGQEGLLQGFGVPLSALRKSRFEHCLIVIDEDRSNDEQLTELTHALHSVWGENAALVVAQPSVESWMLEGHRAFSRIPQLRGIDVRRWFAETGVWPLGTDTPDQPRHALEALFSAFRIEPSNAHYRLIGRHFPIRLDTITSSSFRRLIVQLGEWFPG
ncbi:MAG: hypothetical protein ACPGQS_02680 [Bradymonadia bacterium]